jgi:hypothetical protein
MKAASALAVGVIACILGAFAVTGAAGAAQAAVSAKKKCPAGKVLKKGKCVKKKKKGSAGATVRSGTYACNLAPSGYGAYGVLKIVAGSRYRVNDGKLGTYGYNSATGRINFKTGDYRGFYGVLDKKTIAIHSAVSDKYLKRGDWLWSCYR